MKDKRIVAVPAKWPLSVVSAHGDLVFRGGTCLCHTCRRLYSFVQYSESGFCRYSCSFCLAFQFNVWQQSKLSWSVSGLFVCANLGLVVTQLRF